LLADFLTTLARVAPSLTLADLARLAPERRILLIQECYAAANDKVTVWTATRILGLIDEANADAATMPTLRAQAATAPSPSTDAQKRGTNRQQLMAAGVQEQGGASAISVI
jgi:hypothetical protein